MLACRLCADKSRLLRDVYDKGASIYHLENLLKTSEGRNSGLVDQAESAKARKVASEKRMHALEAHAAELEHKMTRYRSKMDSQLKARPSTVLSHLSVQWDSELGPLSVFGSVCQPPLCVSALSLCVGCLSLCVSFSLCVSDLCVSPLSESRCVSSHASMHATGARGSVAGQAGCLQGAARCTCKPSARA